MKNKIFKYNGQYYRIIQNGFDVQAKELKDNLRAKMHGHATIRNGSGIYEAMAFNVPKASITGTDD